MWAAHLALAHVDRLGEEGDVALVVHLDERPHLPALLPVPRGVEEHDVGGPHGLPGGPGGGDVAVPGATIHHHQLTPRAPTLGSRPSTW